MLRKYAKTLVILREVAGRRSAQAQLITERAVLREHLSRYFGDMLRRGEAVLLRTCFGARTLALV